jgi:hypothetical protein
MRALSKLETRKRITPLIGYGPTTLSLALLFYRIPLSAVTALLFPVALPLTIIGT